MNRFSYLLKKSFSFRFLIFLLIFFVIITLVIAITQLTIKEPYIDFISPTLAEENILVTISGNNFGYSNGGSWIQIGDYIIQSENCKSWNNTKIVFEYPEYQNEGLVKVVAQSKKSNALFLANKKRVPIVKKKLVKNGFPVISSISSNYESVGSAITILGKRFGNSRGNSQVIFLSNFNASIISQLEREDAVEGAFCSEHDFDFISWSDDELKVKVPDGAGSGMIVVKTSNGISEAIPFNIKHRIGKKIISNRKKFVLASEVTVSDIESESVNSLFLKIPLPINNFHQTGLKILSVNPLPFVENYQGSTIHRYENLKPDAKILVREEYSINSYEINTRINPVNVRINSKRNKELYAKYIKADAFLPSEDLIIKQLINKIIKNERNPYNKAKRIYNYLVNNIELLPTSPLNSGVSPVKALENKRVDTYDAAILFATLARACGIPAEPVAGIVVGNKQESFLHWWAQFYLEGFGWVPVDIGMAKGIPIDLGLQQKERYYFGNLDAFRVAFSQGQTIQVPMILDSESSTKDRSYAFSDSWEEFVGIKKLSSVWKIPKVIAIY